MPVVFFRLTLFGAVFVGQTPSVSALALLDVVVASCPMEDFSTPSSSATQPLHFKVCADRRKTRWVLVQHGRAHEAVEDVVGDRLEIH